MTKQCKYISHIVRAGYPAILKLIWCGESIVQTITALMMAYSLGETFSRSLVIYGCRSIFFTLSPAAIASFKIITIFFRSHSRTCFKIPAFCKRSRFCVSLVYVVFVTLTPKLDVISPVFGSSSVTIIRLFNRKMI